MITKQQQEALKNLTDYVERYCNENGISILMTAAVGEEHPTSTEQICSTVVLGKGKHIIGSLIGGIKTKNKFGLLLSQALLEAARVEGEITTIPTGNINMN